MADSPTSSTVRIVEVGPRDGLQNEAGRVPTAEKAELVRALIATGVPEIELTSFVSPKWIPQLGDAAELLEMLAGDLPGHITFSALVPNMQGMERLLEANEKALRAVSRRAIDKVCLFTAASETFSKKNTNASIEESIERMKPVVEAAKHHELGLRLYVSCAFGCPFEGEIRPKQVASTIRLAALLFGVEDDHWLLENIEVSPSDTIGAATPGKIDLVLEAIEHEAATWWIRRYNNLNLHLHDTFGRAADCVRAGLRAGVRSFDGAIGGLGGCPYASTPGKRAPGNIATSTLVQVVEDEGFATGVEHAGLGAARRLADDLVARARSGAPA